MSRLLAIAVLLAALVAVLLLLPGRARAALETGGAFLYAGVMWNPAVTPGPPAASGFEVGTASPR